MACLVRNDVRRDGCGAARDPGPWRQQASLADAPAPRCLAAQIAAALALVALHLADALARPIPLGLGGRRQDGEYSLDTPLPVVSPPRSIIWGTASLAS